MMRVLREPLVRLVRLVQDTWATELPVHHFTAKTLITPESFGI